MLKCYEITWLDADGDVLDQRDIHAVNLPIIMKRLAAVPTFGAASITVMEVKEDGTG